MAKLFTTTLLLLILFFAILLLTEPILVLAQDTDCPPNTICIDNPLEAETIDEIICAISDLLKLVAIPLGTVMLIWGGIQIMTGMTTGEKESKVVQGKKTIMWAVVGVAIVLMVDFIVEFVVEILQGGTAPPLCQ